MLHVSSWKFESGVDGWTQVYHQEIQIVFKLLFYEGSLFVSSCFLLNFNWQLARSNEQVSCNTSLSLRCLYMFLYVRRQCLILAYIKCVWTQIFSGVGRMFRAADDKWFLIWHWFMTGKKGALVFLTMVLPSPILLRRCSSLLSSWVIQALAKAGAAAAELPPHFMRTVSAFATKMSLKPSILEALHTHSLSQSPVSLMCCYISHGSHNANI